MDFHNIHGSAIKLEGQKNWSVWKFQVTVTLKGAGLFSIVSDEKIKEKPENFDARDAKAQAIIVSRLTEAVMVHVLTCKSSEEMWKKLHSVYEAKSATSTLMLQQKFFQFKYEGGDSATFLSKLQEMTCQLKQAGEEISDKFLITKILMSLPECYGHFISAWESVESSKQVYDDLVARLLVEEERMKARGSDKGSENVALHVQQHKKSHTVKKCFKCGKSGHFVQQCKSNNDKRKCFLCHETGHLKHECPKRKSSVYDKSNGGHALISHVLSSRSNIDSSSDGKWLIDSGASEHISKDQSLFTNYKVVSNRHVIVGDGRCLPVSGIGDIKLKLFDGKNYVNSTLYDVLHVPDIKINLFSVMVATRKGYVVKMLNEKCCIYKGSLLCAIGNLKGKAYVLDVLYDECMNKVDVAAVSLLSEWHERLGHQSLDYVKKVLTDNNIQFQNDKQQCVACLQGKIHRLPFIESTRFTSKPLELVHSDVCGPMEVESVGGSRYFLLLKDDFTNFRFVYFLKCKSEVPSKFKQFINWSKRQTEFKLKTIREPVEPWHYVYLGHWVVSNIRAILNSTVYGIR